MEFRAEMRYLRVSPQKARLVLELIKGRKVEDALNILVFTKKRVAATVEKLLRSALENANYLSSEKGIDVDVDKLYVKDAVANDGPRMKRIRPAPMGRAFRYAERPNRFVYGSDWPLVPMGPYSAFIRSAIPEMFHAQVFEENARNLFRLSPV